MRTSTELQTRWTRCFVISLNFVTFSLALPQAPIDMPLDYEEHRIVELDPEYEALTKTNDTEVDYEKLFLERHPDVKDVIWNEVKNLTRATLRKICDHLLPAVITRFDWDRPEDFHYEEVAPHLNPKTERCIFRAVLPIQDPMVRTARIPVLKCYYTEMKFYITHGDDKHVFTLVREPGTHIFTLGKMIPIDYDKVLH